MEKSSSERWYRDNWLRKFRMIIADFILGTAWVCYPRNSSESEDILVFLEQRTMQRIANKKAVKISSANAHNSTFNNSGPYEYYRW